MKYFLRLGWTILAAGGATLAIGGNQVAAQPISIFSDTPAYLAHGSQSYLGVDVHDIDNERATALKLKDVHGAEIVTIDHDAPANKAGLKIHDVVLEMNGERVEGADQLRRMLRETPPGHTVHFLISRDGKEQKISVELADRAKIEANAWAKHFTVPDPREESENGLMSPSRWFGNGFFGVFTPNGLYIGADVDVLSTQLANYFGVSDGTGLLVRSVDENSPAATAGLKAGDVITRVNNTSMASRADWLKILHNNRGKQVQLTVMRDKKEQKLNMQAGEPKKKGELELPELCPDAFDGSQLEAKLQAFDTLDTSEISRSVQQAQDQMAQAQKTLNSIDMEKLQHAMKEMQNRMQTFDFDQLQSSTAELF